MRSLTALILILVHANGKMDRIALVGHQESTCATLLTGLDEQTRLLGGTLHLESRHPQPPPAGTAPRVSSWSGAPGFLNELIRARGVETLVTGPDADVAHLALQFSLKTRVRVVLVGCRDRQVQSLPIPGVERIEVEAPELDASFLDAGRKLGSLMLGRRSSVR